MTKQRALLVSAIVGNGVLIVLASAAVGSAFWAERFVLNDPFTILALFAISVVLVPLIAMAGRILVCVRTALVRCGHTRDKAIAEGKTLCVAMTVVGLLLSMCFYFPLPVIVIGTVAFVTNKVFSDVLAESKRGFFCPQCEYDLVGLAGTKCPECGLQVKPEPGT